MGEAYRCDECGFRIATIASEWGYLCGSCHNENLIEEAREEKYE